jgi:O-antigen ligase
MHPNQLGPVASMGLALVLSNWRRMYGPLVLLFGVTLWLTDSRTQVATALIVFAVWGVHHLRLQLGWKETVQIVSGLIVSASIGIVSVLAIRDWNVGVPTFGLARRPDVWAKAFDYWQSSKWVGVGPVAFDDGWVTPNGRKFLGAHNEVMQALAAEGLLGVLPLLCLLGGFAFAVRAARGRARFTLVMMSIFGLALISMETPLRPEQTITGLGILFVGSIFALVSASSTTGEAESRRVSS